MKSYEEIIKNFKMTFFEEGSTLFTKAKGEDIQELKELFGIKMEKVIDFYANYEPNEIPMLNCNIQLHNIERILDENYRCEPGKYLAMYGVYVFATTIGGGCVCLDTNNIVNGEPSILAVDSSFAYFDNEHDCIGIYLWKNENEYYKGDYINNIKNGKGLYLFNNGNIYIGQWINGKPSGKGAYETKNKIYNGIWKNGSFIKIYDVISKYQSEEINENINFNFFTNTENIDINNLEHISTKNIPEII